MMADVAHKPASLSVEPAGVPKTLTARKRFVAWEYRLNKNRDKWSKVPLRPDGGGLASSTDETTWGTPNEAWRVYQPNGKPVKAGIGYVFVAKDGEVGVDLDACRNPETGELDAVAKLIVAKLNTYCEVSPSGLGVKLWARGDWPIDADNQNAEHGIEVYRDSRYFAVTGVRVEGTPADIRECQAELDWLRETYFVKKKTPPPSNSNSAGTSHKLDVEKWLTARGVTFRRKEKLSKHGQARWCITCPFDSTHGDPDACIFQKPDGELGFKCLHTSCAGRKWRDARDKIGKPDNDHFDPPIIRVTIKGGQSKTGTAGVDQSPEEIIRRYFVQRYKPDFRFGNVIHTADGELVTLPMALDTPTSAVIAALASADDVPTFQGGGVKKNALPGFYRTWARVAWGNLLADLPDEDHAPDTGLAGEEFLRLVKNAMLSEVVLGEHIDARRVVQTQIERRSLIEWCERFQRPGRWESIRSKRCWCKSVVTGDGEIILRVAVRHELFAQLKADRRLVEMNANTFTRRAERYGLGTSSRASRPGGMSAVVLADAFVADLLAKLPEDPDAGTTEGQPTPEVGQPERTKTTTDH